MGGTDTERGINTERGTNIEGEGAHSMYLVFIYSLNMSIYHFSEAKYDL